MSDKHLYYIGGRRVSKQEYERHKRKPEKRESGQTIPDEAVEAGRDAMAYMYPGKVDGILVEEILQAAAPIIRADERERVKARVEALAIVAADNGIPFNLADYYEAIEGTDDE